MTKRQPPRWDELEPLLGTKLIELNPTRRRLDTALAIAELQWVRPCWDGSPSEGSPSTTGALQATVKARHWPVEHRRRLADRGRPSRASLA